MMPEFQAFQELTATNKVIRWAICPKHSKRSSNFTGVVRDVADSLHWSFRCTASDHVFSAKADPTAPKNQAGVKAWYAKQLQARLKTLA